MAVREKTLAILEQRYLIAKFRLDSRLFEAPQMGIAVVPASTDRIPPAEGPFGLKAGLSMETIERMTGEKLLLTSEAQSLYVLTHSPEPDAAFEHYALVISPTVGLCQIRAIGKTIDSDDYGQQLKASFDGITH